MQSCLSDDSRGVERSYKSMNRNKNSYVPTHTHTHVHHIHIRRFHFSCVNSLSFLFISFLIPHHEFTMCLAAPPSIETLVLIFITQYTTT